MAGTLEIPSIGSSNASQDPKIKSSLETLNSKLNSENKLEAANVAGTLSDTQLASPNNSAYRVLLAPPASRFAVDQGAGTYILAGNDSQNALASTAAFNEFAPPFVYFDDADYTVAGKTQKLRVRAQVACNATKAAIKFTFGLYPVTVAGAADLIAFTLGTVVSGSTVEINEPAASTISSGVGSDFTIPADGAYMLGVVSSGTLTNNSYCLVNAQLQTRSV